jgi:hypothetical protein
VVDRLSGENRVVELKQSAQANDMGLSWRAAGTIDASRVAEIVSMVYVQESDNGEQPCRVVLFFGGDRLVAGMANQTELAAPDKEWRLWQFTSGSYVQLDASSATEGLTADGWEDGSFFWVRLRWEPDNGMVRARFWMDGMGEPSTWQMQSPPSTTPASGRAGIEARSQSNRVWSWARVGVGDDGDSAPKDSSPATPSDAKMEEVEKVTPVLSDDRIVDEDRESWGVLQFVRDDSVDVTWLDDGTPLIAEQWSSGMPFADGPARVRVPGRDYTDPEVVGWLDQNFEIRRYPMDGSDPTTLWEGYVVDVSDDGGDTVIEMAGAHFQLDEYVRAPLVVTEGVDVVDFINAQYSQSTRPHLRFTVPDDGDDQSWITVEDSPPAVKTRQTGSWDAALTGYLRDVLFLLQKTDGTRFRIDLDRPRTPVLRRIKEVSAAAADATVDARWPGVEPSLSVDARETVNVLYGEGTNKAGQTYRNADYTTGIAEYEPFAHTDAAHPKGNANFDPDIIRRERHLQFPSGTSFSRAMESAEQVLARDKDPRWVGDVELRVDPEEFSRFELQAGMVILLKNHRGADRPLQIVEVEVDWSDLSVSLTVDEQARDVLTVAEILERRRRSSRSTVANLRRGSTGSVVEDTKVPWDDEAGSGYLPMGAKDAGDPASDPPSNSPNAFVELSNGAWAVEKVFAAQRATVGETTMQLYDSNGNEVAAPFYAAIFDGKVTAGDLDSPPLDVGHSWSSLPSGVSEIIGWGVDGQRAGYSPGLESNGDGQTGRLDDENTWQFDLAEGQGEVWLAVWLDGGPSMAYLQGRMVQGVE